jgi:hypothetical protein|uniref:Uncharacterized protein n=1 Tax=Picea sitchensis TaxID=3332 RepID=A0A6B9XPU8_PICSI|nr:hypothetical protein Q903MT_gene3996 [Picea sitchensis]
MLAAVNTSIPIFTPSNAHAFEVPFQREVQIRRQTIGSLALLGGSIDHEALAFVVINMLKVSTII